MRQSVVVVLSDGEDLSIGQEVNFGAALLGAAGLLELGSRLAFGIFLHKGAFFRAPDFQLQQFAEGVHAGNAYAVQPAGDFVAGGIELAAGVQLGHHYFRRRDFFAIDIHRADGNTAAVVDHGDGIINVNGDIDFGGIAGQGLVHRVVHHFIHQVV